MPDDDDLPAGPPRGAERTVMVSAADLAALHGTTPPADPFAAPADPFAPPPADPFGAAATPDPFGAMPPAEPVAADPFASEAPVFAPPPTFVPPPSTPPGVPAATTGGAGGSSPGGFLHGSPGGLVGMHLNDLFEIVRFIAQGGMGEVYEGRNLASNERVAIKVILPQYAADEQFMALFRREASALERIGHDSLVKYRTLAFDRTNRINYLAIEYVSGPSMADILVGDPADPAVVRRVLKRLATGLGAAHDAGVIHRDLSPDNLLLPDGNVERCKIIDFGIAKDTNPGEKSVVGEAFAGKFGYAAPEIFGKFKRAGRAVDRRLQPRAGDDRLCPRRPARHGRDDRRRARGARHGPRPVVDRARPPAGVRQDARPRPGRALPVDGRGDRGDGRAGRDVRAGVAVRRDGGDDPAGRAGRRPRLRPRDDHRAHARRAGQAVEPAALRWHRRGGPPRCRRRGLCPARRQVGPAGSRDQRRRGINVGGAKRDTRDGSRRTPPPPRRPRTGRRRAPPSSPRSTACRAATCGSARCRRARPSISPAGTRPAWRYRRARAG